MSIVTSMVIAAVSMVALAVALVYLVSITPMFEYKKDYTCGRTEVYRPCPWSEEK